MKSEIRMPLYDFLGRWLGKLSRFSGRNNLSLLACPHSDGCDITYSLWPRRESHFGVRHEHSLDYFAVSLNQLYMSQLHLYKSPPW